MEGLKMPGYSLYVVQFSPAAQMFPRLRLLPAHRLCLCQQRELVSAVVKVDT